MIEEGAGGASARDPFAARPAGHSHGRASPKDGERIAPIGPDLIGEAFMLVCLPALVRPRTGGVFARSFRRSPDASAAAVMRTAQDFAEGEDRPALRWLDRLAKRCESVADLMQLADAFPHQTLALRERAAAITSASQSILAAQTESGVRPLGARRGSPSTTSPFV